VRERGACRRRGEKWSRRSMRRGGRVEEDGVGGRESGEDVRVR